MKSVWYWEIKGNTAIVDCKKALSRRALVSFLIERCRQIVGGVSRIVIDSKFWWDKKQSHKYVGRRPSTAQPCCLWNGQCSFAIGQHILFFFIKSSFFFTIHCSAYLKIVSDQGAVWKNANHPKHNKNKN